MNSGWEKVKTQCLMCEKCPLAATRTNIVFGVGSELAEVLFIGEGPGEQEDLKGEPFVGRAGQLLDKLLDCVNLNRHKNIYIANMVKCRPPGNRDPQPEEQEACIGWLREQTRLLRPKIIVCLGRIAAQRLISPDFKVTQEHGKFINKNGTLMMGTYHPAALLRNPNNKPDAFQDFLDLREKIKEVCERTYTDETDG